MKTCIAVLAALLGACSGSGSSSDPVKPPAAAEVSYDATASGLAAGNVQAAVDEVAATATAQGKAVTALGPRLDALEGASVGAAKVGYDATASGLAATTVQAAVDELAASATGASGERSKLAADQTTLSGRVTALEGATVGAADVTLATVEGLPAATVQAGIEALRDLVVAQKAENDALKAELAASKACPDGFDTVGESCVESTPRVKLPWTDAVKDCVFPGYRLCRYDEYAMWSCSHPPPDEPEWTIALIGPAQGLLVKFPEPPCASVYVEVAGVGDNDPAHPYRCCKTR